MGVRVLFYFDLTNNKEQRNLSNKIQYYCQLPRSDKQATKGKRKDVPKKHYHSFLTCLSTSLISGNSLLSVIVHYLGSWISDISSRLKNNGLTVAP